ncbi:MAG TPA: hypothetical protein VJ862_05625 [Rhodanobacteraceae bacterium]|nr:hypothetical protein [Rhodanobacteraceae bacterium]
MNAPATDTELRERRLRALGVEPWRLRARVPAPVPAAPVEHEAQRTEPAPVACRIRRLALQPDSSELRDPAINKMYMALTEAVAKAGLQPVRVCDVADDPGAAVMVFGAAPLPDVPAVRVLRADPLVVLHADRDRKRALWERLQALGSNGS